LLSADYLTLTPYKILIMRKKRLFRIKWLLFVLSILSCSCSYKQDQVLFQSNETTMPALPPGVNYDGIYRIHQQDILQVRNMQNMKYIIDDASAKQGAGGGDETAQTYTVEPDGTIGLPVIGSVKVEGLTRFEAEKKIADLYSQKLIRNPIIQVQVINSKVTVFGEVKTPGNYPLIKDQTTLTEILGEAGGLTDKADEKKVKIIRGGPQNPQVTIVDLSQVNTLSNPEVLLQNQDIIYVLRNKKAIRNDKLQTFSTTIQPILIVLNTVLIIFTLSKH
jgi:polysaccharide biosynthesis/export protein